MSFFNDTVPSGSEAVKLGAQRIREMKTSLNTVIGKIFSDAGEFLTKWITTSQLGDRVVGMEQLADGAVGATQLAQAALSADTTGRSKMADGFLTVGKLAAGFVLPNGNVGTDQLADSGVTTNKLADAAVTMAKAATGLLKVSTGTYSGSDSVSANVNSLPWTPDFILLVHSATKHIIGLAVQADAVTGRSPVHFLSSGNEDITSPYTSAVEWQANGFIYRPAGAIFNSSGRTHRYFAFKV